ncbi:PhnA domain-containing protein [Desulforhopalus sp. 52FAK]
MNNEEQLRERSDSSCELCAAKDNLALYVVGPENAGAEPELLLCSTCIEQVESNEALDENHWRCLNDSMWSQVPAVQVLAWRMLTLLADKGWPQDLLDMMYLEDDVLTWAKAGLPDGGGDSVVHRDSNGTTLSAGDSVTLIKDLNVKGGGFTAKRGTLVKSISLVTDNAEHIEGKVSGQHIVILTKFVKKSS